MRSIEDVKELLLALRMAGSSDSVMLLGPPGIGKTEGVYQLLIDEAKFLGKTPIRYDDGKLDTILKNPEKYHVLVDFSLTQCEPSDLIGIPRDEDGHIRYKPLGWAVALAKSSGILFLDEITNVQRMDVQSVMLKLLLEKLVGFTKMRDDVRVIAAGNRPEHSSLAVDSFPEPVRSGRVILLDVDVPQLEEWVDYMDREVGDWDKRIFLFLKRFPQFFYDATEKTDGYDVRATPRSWTKLAKISHKIDAEKIGDLAIGLLGANVAPLLRSFLETKIPKLTELRIEDWDRLTIEQKYFVALELASEPDELLGKNKRFMEVMARNDREMLILTFLLLEKDQRAKIAMRSRTASKEVFNALIYVAKMIRGLEHGL